MKAWAAAGPGGRLLGAMRTRAAALPGMGAVGAKGAVGAVAGRERSPRARRFVLSAALVGLCSLVVAVAYTGGLRQGAENSAAPRPGESGAAAPGGSKPTATATSTVTATRSPGGNGYKPSSPVRGPVLEWLFDAVDDGTTVDTSGRGKDGTLDGDPLPEPVKGGALEFDGEQSVVSDGPVVDTSKSFSVSARAKLNGTEDFQTVVSQDASYISGFAVQYDPDSDRWEMIAPEEDDEDAELVQAGGSPGPPADKWTYLTGVHDAGAGEIRLYVDGKLEGKASVGGGGGGAAAGGGADGAAGSGGSPTATPTATSGGGAGGGGGGAGRNGGGGRGGPGGFGGGGRSGPGGGGGFFGGPVGRGDDLAVSAADAVGAADAADAAGAARAAGAQVIDADGDFAVGRSLAGEEFDRGFDGTIDDVRAFKRALTAREVAALAGR
ncbi:LamG domain-containing protein [Streptomyces sp. HNM0575]|nr:LamG domain-containing protein [Streptomyces sp. HNM0575]